MAITLVKEYRIRVKIPDKPYDEFFAIVRNGKVDKLDGIGDSGKCTLTRIEAYIQFLNEVLEAPYL